MQFRKIRRMHFKATQTFHLKQTDKKLCDDTNLCETRAKRGEKQMASFSFFCASGQEAVF